MHYKNDSGNYKPDNIYSLISSYKLQYSFPNTRIVENKLQKLEQYI